MASAAMFARVIRSHRPVVGSRWLVARTVPWASKSLPLCRAFSEASSSSLKPHTPNSEVLPQSGGTSLADLAQRSSLLPKPETFDEKLKPGFRGGRALFLFFLCNALPFAGLLYYLRGQRSERAQLSLLSLPLSASDVVAEALRVMKTASTCFFQRHGDASGGVLLVDPHLPEGSAYSSPTEPLPLLPELDRNVLTDLLESPPSAGLGFVHFALSRNSPAGKAVLAGDRRAHLMYVSGTRAAYCTVTGQLSVLSDPDSRRRYWKSFWAFSFPVDPPPAPPPVSTAGQSPATVPELPPAWSATDYLCVRLAVSEVSLHAMVDGPQRWQARRVKRLDNSSDPTGTALDWSFVAPDAL